MRKTVLTAIAALGAGVAVVLSTGLSSAQPEAGSWQQVGADVKSGISGLAVASRSGDTLHALVVRDNKRPGDNRIADVVYRPGQAATVTPITWQGGAEPIDLEALDAVPGTSDEYVAVASRGLAYHLKLIDAGEAVRVLDVAPLPEIGAGDDFESFTLTSRHGKTAAVWADRGAGADRPATLYAAPFSINSYGESKFGAVKKATLRAPYPRGDVRHASDIEVTKSGRLLVSSASDAGDDGPFDSAVSDAGRLSVAPSGKVRLSVDRSPEVLEKFEGHKIEAVHCVPGSGLAALGTDDENAGGSLSTRHLCD
ncbi:hypothetical protein GCM10009837_19120 [Streptomyces durmitorensis]|uniref:Uncharacterized protein n=1 Tax=Streptomyces durmitorensis TaxID=319947 RepID=A0ABY4PQ74_9ACTN|nr:hypothetical protein [Streptomyces durmitorensis]UQT55414.1 hypothetical protein M4V62_10085 [Streptomyces durmitorensis]